MCGREKDKDKSSSIICHLLPAAVKTRVEKERQCVGERKIKTRVAQLYRHLLAAMVEKDNVWERER